jgi:hypothetical protein
MTFLRVFLAGATVLLLGSSGAAAGVYSDEMTKCLVSSTTDEDKIGLVRWMFAAASRHPAVKDVISVAEGEMEKATEQAAAIFERLLTESCAKQLHEAVKYEGQPAVAASFTALGQVAGIALMGHPEVAVGLQALEAKLDKAKVRAVVEKGPN